MNEAKEHPEKNLYLVWFDFGRKQQFIFSQVRRTGILGANSLLGELVAYDLVNIAKKYQGYQIEFRPNPSTCYRAKLDLRLSKKLIAPDNLFSSGILANFGGHFQVVFDNVAGARNFVSAAVKKGKERAPELLLVPAIVQFKTTDLYDLVCKAAQKQVGNNRDNLHAMNIHDVVSFEVITPNGKTDIRITKTDEIAPIITWELPVANPFLHHCEASGIGYASIRRLDEYVSAETKAKLDQGDAFLNKPSTITRPNDYLFCFQQDLINMLNAWTENKFTFHFTLEDPEETAARGKQRRKNREAAPQSNDNDTDDNHGQPYHALVFADANAMSWKFRDLMNKVGKMKFFTGAVEAEAFWETLRVYTRETLALALIATTAYELLRQTGQAKSNDQEWRAISFDCAETEKAYKKTFFDPSKDFDNDIIKNFISPLVAAWSETKKKDIAIPIQLLMLGGDDLWLAASAELSLHFVAAYHWYYHHRERRKNLPEHFKDGLSFSAGILVHPAKFPFATAYGMTEDLCDSAKKKCRQYDSKASTIDWHILKNNTVNEDLDAYRRREYLVQKEKQTLILTGRPYLIRNDDGNESQSIERCTFIQQLQVSASIMADLQQRENDKAGGYARNKLKNLRSTLRKGKCYSNLIATFDLLADGKIKKVQDDLRLPDDSLWHTADDDTSFLTPWIDINELLEFCPQDYALPEYQSITPTSTNGAANG